MNDINNKKIGYCFDEAKFKIADEEFELLSMQLQLKYDWEKGSLPRYITGGNKHFVCIIPKGSCLKTLIPPATDSEHPKLIWECPAKEEEMLYLLIVEESDTYTHEKRSYIGSYRDPNYGSICHLFFDLTYEHQKKEEDVDL